MASKSWTVICYLLIHVTNSFTQTDLDHDTCEPVTCGGQNICHEKEIVCDPIIGKCNVTRWCLFGLPTCDITVPYCSQKNKEDYKKDYLDSKKDFNFTRLKDQNITEEEEKFLCRGFKCFGLGQCKTVSIPIVTNGTIINDTHILFVPACDDSPSLNNAMRLKKKLMSSDQYKGPLSWMDLIYIISVLLSFGLVFLVVYFFVWAMEQ